MGERGSVAESSKLIVLVEKKKNLYCNVKTKKEKRVENVLRQLRKNSQ